MTTATISPLFHTVKPSELELAINMKHSVLAFIWQKYDTKSKAYQGDVYNQTIRVDFKEFAEHCQIKVAKNLDQYVSIKNQVKAGYIKIEAKDPTRPRSGKVIVVNPAYAFYGEKGTQEMAVRSFGTQTRPTTDKENLGLLLYKEQMKNEQSDAVISELKTQVERQDEIIAAMAKELAELKALVKPETEEVELDF